MIYAIGGFRCIKYKVTISTKLIFKNLEVLAFIDLNRNAKQNISVRLSVYAINLWGIVFG